MQSTRCKIHKITIPGQGMCSGHSASGANWPPHRERSDLDTRTIARSSPPLCSGRVTQSGWSELWCFCRGGTRYLPRWYQKVKRRPWMYIDVHTHAWRQLLKLVVALNPRMAKMDMEAYRDVALFIIPTRTASLSQLFLMDTEQNWKYTFVNYNKILPGLGRGNWGDVYSYFSSL